MNIQTLQAKINHLNGVAFNLIYLGFRDSILKQGIEESAFLEFNIVDEIKKDIEKELIAFILKNDVDEKLEAHKFNFFTPMLSVVKKYAFLGDEKTKFYHRRCFITGDVFSQGFVMPSGKYIKEKEVAVAHLRINQSDEQSRMTDSQLLEDMYDEDCFYYTEWVDANDYCFAVDSNGTIHQINED